MRIILYISNQPSHGVAGWEREGKLSSICIKNERKVENSEPNDLHIHVSEMNKCSKKQFLKVKPSSEIS